MTDKQSDALNPNTRRGAARALYGDLNPATSAERAEMKTFLDELIGGGS